MKETSSTPRSETTIATRLLLQGSVQGVGVRPAIMKLASELKLCGFVANEMRGVEIYIEGSGIEIDEFADRLQAELPRGARFGNLTRMHSAVIGLQQFEIRTVKSTGAVATLVPHDMAVCEQCNDEVTHALDRRAGYAFTSCTNCGPRYSIIHTMPYERSQTSMGQFDLCEPCRSEFEGANDRRFHAQTNACADCGPTVCCGETTEQGKSAITAAAIELKNGGIVALKGLGGYQLLCDATSETAVRRLRDRKHRRTKPLPVMISAPSRPEEFPAALFDASNPIVLVPFDLVGNLAESVHANFNTVAVMLPTTPLHRLLLRECGRPLVVTSGNIESEPLAYENDDATESLHGVADLFLHHNRRIVRPIDDSVVQTCGNRTVSIRAARGIAPLPLALQTDRSILAVGGHQKVAVALSNKKQAVLGPHIGDLDSLAARERFVSHTRSLIDLYGCNPEVIVHDLHPDYFTTRWAEEQPQPTIAVQHHHAHIVSGILEHAWLDRKVLGIAFDGTGYGPDGTIWGGEFLLATATQFHRVGHLRPFTLPGGELSVRQPWRVALSLLTETLGSAAAIELLHGEAETSQLQALAKLIERRQAGPMTTSAGRLFDGVAALLLPLADVSFAGEPAMRLESICDDSEPASYSFSVTEIDEVVSLDWRPVLAEIVGDLTQGVEIGAIAMRFHRAIARAIANLAKKYAELPIILSGGCFQNRLLTELVLEQFAGGPQTVGLPGTIPPGDGGLAAGQLAIAAARLATGHLEQGLPSCV
ncbi:Carbamoyltransferase HypF [Symmachiella macrocystis]|uniref:Carbamoyltransferase n=1 Tax=Symmachiella macrocystis TaxID=2527985 RepID=A0A5C6B9P0_9PLAN|nr:carbamoyltransferase HypF [Symmachiella macrocystis]TWU08803.1 Carbamoyltransferase HypF [Symmachiella macrocystis]